MNTTMARTLRAYALATAAVVIAYRYCLSDQSQALAAAVTAQLMVAGVFFAGGFVFSLYDGFGLSPERRAAVAGTGLAALAVATFGVALALAFRIALSSETPSVLTFAVLLPFAAYFVAILLVAGASVGTLLGVPLPAAAGSCAASALCFATLVIDDEPRHASAMAVAAMVTAILGPPLMRAFKRKNRPR